ncbi:conserved exported hypothetical protein [Candidatus Sulfopaludibacter sp. SbA3]|nr:conserved exported hypothetical protein [Candidatus Sulfopaludibacter sp. SbA3]
MVRLLAFLTLAGLYTNAQELCRAGLFAEDQGDLRVMLVAGSGHAFFYQDTTPGCPQKGPECKTAGGVESGAEVLVSKVRNGFACVWQSHDAVGWIPQSRLDLTLPLDRKPPLFAWIGDWKFFDNHLEIAVTPDGQRLRLNGHAFWRGINATHDGSIEADAAPTGNHAIFRPARSTCEVRLTLVRHQLVAADNHACGGANVTFGGVYEMARQPFDAQSTSTLKYGRNSNGQDTVDITNAAYELAQTDNDHHLILRLTHTEKNVVGDIGDQAKITVEAWPLGVNLKENPLYSVELDGNDATVVDSALLIFDRTEEAPWWSVYHLDNGKHFFDTNAPLLRFSITDIVQTERYAGLEISNDNTADKRLKARGVVGVLTYASGDRVIREALITCDNDERAQLLHSLADTTFELAAVNKAIRVALTPFDPNGHSPAAVITVAVVNDDLDLVHARLPAGMHLTAWRR